MITDRFFLKCEKFTLIYDGLVKIRPAHYPRCLGPDLCLDLSAGSEGSDWMRTNRFSETFLHPVINI